jgi:hypothetical protein
MHNDHRGADAVIVFRKMAIVRHVADKYADTRS